MSVQACTCARCERLLEENAWLRSELGLEVEVDHLSRIARSTGLSPQPARLLAVLYARRGHVVRRETLIDAAPSVWARERVDDRLWLNVTISKIRAALGGRETVQVAWGRGYRLAEEAADRLEAVLQQPGAPDSQAAA